MVPVLHIVGTPSTVQQKVKPILHHTLGDGRYEAYALAAAQFSIFQANLTDKKTAASLIDRALTECIKLVQTYVSRKDCVFILLLGSSGLCDVAYGHSDARDFF